MTEEQLRHREAVIYQFASEIERKYNKGQNEHGGNLWEKPVLNELSDELVDAVVYYQTLKQKISAINKELLEFIEEACAYYPNSVTDKLLELHQKLKDL